MEPEQFGTATKLLGLIGNPVAHSLSPLLHRELAKKYGHSYVYLAFPVEKEYLSDAVKGAWALHTKGLNVTVPYKKAVMEVLCGIDENAKRIGAVNTLVWTENGYYGYNTDMPGLARAMQHDGVNVCGKNVVLIGAGGAANAALCMALENEAENILILNRSKEKALELAVHFKQFYEKTNIQVAAFAEDYLSIMDQISKDKWIAIQATSVGMHPNIEDTPIEDKNFYERIAVGYDLIFNPKETKFLQMVRLTGGKTFNGLKMLLFQGIYAYELWNHIEVSDSVAEAVLEQMREELNRRG